MPKSLNKVRMWPFITIKVKVVGFHLWHHAPKKVKFLSAHHRHTFTCKVSIRVDGYDRSEEFVLMRQKILRILSRYPKVYDGYDFCGMSCEQLAEYMAEELLKKGHRVCEVSFSEDDEFEGGVVVEALEK